jgi:hypothetical protein
MKTIVTLPALALALALAAPASAQDHARPAAAETTFTFDDDRVDGEYRRALGEVLHVRTRHGRESLVRPRPHFIPELLVSVERI